MLARRMDITPASSECVKGNSIVSEVSSGVDMKSIDKKKQISSDDKLLTNPGVDTSVPITSFESIESIINRYVPAEEAKEVFRVLHGGGSLPVPVSEDLQKLSKEKNFEVRVESLVQHCEEHQCRRRRLVKIGAIQNGIVIETTRSVQEQGDAIRNRVGEMIDCAGRLGVNVLCLQEAWPMPFAFCTRERHPWMEFAEDVQNGISAQFISEKARRWGMVIVSPILERDSVHQDTIWNTAVVFGTEGEYIGKHRKNHIPRVGDFNESTYYLEGNTGHPVFDTKFGKISINICYGRHHPLNWMAFALNGAEIVFNPSATVGALSEPLWSLEARNAAVANSFYAVSINRVGTEIFPNPFTSGDGKPAHRDFGHFYGSSYVSSPNGARTNSLSRLRDGILAVDIDLNLIQQTKDKWMFQATARYEMYANLLNRYIRHDFKPQVIKSGQQASNKASSPLNGYEYYENYFD